MIGLHEARLLGHIAKWRLTWDHYDLDEPPPRVPGGLPPVFMTARAAAALIPDGATCVSTGIAAHHRASLLFWAIRDRYRDQAHPRGLTWCAVGAQGGRGKIPGTAEELAVPGLITRLIVGHTETFRAQMRLADAGQLEVHALPQGEFAFLIEDQGEGHFSRLSATGVGTYLDPRCGAGSAVTPDPTTVLVEAEGDLLRYHLPRLEVAVFAAPYADRDGNLYVHDAACLTEMFDAARAVHANGGLVLACVADVIEPGPQHEPYIPAGWMSAIVVSPRVEQTASVPQRHAWPMFTAGAHVPEQAALADVAFINDTLRITPRRTPTDAATARLAAAIMVEHLRPGALVNIGVGLPEQAAAHLYAAGISRDLIQSTESGCYGGIPTSGIFFGSAINAERHCSSAWVFHRYAQGLDLTCLGALEVDCDGNVNVSNRGSRPSDFVGPGGFMDIVPHPPTVVFCSTFANRARMHLSGGRVVIDDPGEGKYVERVQHVTFNGAAALRRGQTVWFVTDVGAFRLTPAGLELARVFPGLDIERDILARSGARIALPSDGADAVAVVPPEIVTGQGFRLGW